MLSRPRTTVCIPFSGRNRSSLLRPLNMAHRSWAWLSFRVKYQCPEEGATKLDISPSTATAGNFSSSSAFASRFTPLTDSTFSSGCALSDAWVLSEASGAASAGVSLNDS